jgi:hypothetical protein
MHKIMPIFTFMGTSLLRMDDTYSMQIVKKTVETVVPAVIKVNMYICVLHTCMYSILCLTIGNRVIIWRLYRFN